MHTQALPQSGLLHLLPHEVVPAVAALPYQPDLVAQDRQVAHEADRRHGPGKEEAAAVAVSSRRRTGEARRSARKRNGRTFQRKKKVHLSTDKVT